MVAPEPPGSIPYTKTNMRPYTQLSQAPCRLSLINFNSVASNTDRIYGYGCHKLRPAILSNCAVTSVEALSPRSADARLKGFPVEDETFCRWIVPQ